MRIDAFLFVKSWERHPARTRDTGSFLEQAVWFHSLVSSLTLVSSSSCSCITPLLGTVAQSRGMCSRVSHFPPPGSPFTHTHPPAQARAPGRPHVPAQPGEQNQADGTILGAARPVLALAHSSVTGIVLVVAPLFLRLFACYCNVSGTFAGLCRDDSEACTCPRAVVSTSHTLVGSPSPLSEAGAIPAPPGQTRK